MSVRRTTVAASTESLATLEAEADRRGVSLSAILAEAVEEKAEALRHGRRPRLGLGASGARRIPDSGAAGSGSVRRNPTAEPVSEPPR